MIIIIDSTWKPMIIEVKNKCSVVWDTMIFEIFGHHHPSNQGLAIQSTITYKTMHSAHLYILDMFWYQFVSLMGSERHPWSPAILRHTFGLLDPPISCLVSFIGTDKIYRLLSTCNKAAASTAARDQDWKLAGKSGQSFTIRVWQK